jgi:hypothetical protein
LSPPHPQLADRQSLIFYIQTSPQTGSPIVKREDAQGGPVYQREDGLLTGEKTKTTFKIVFQLKKHVGINKKYAFELQRAVPGDCSQGEHWKSAR